MDLWKYFAIGHEQHVFCNPLSEAKVDELIALLALSDQAEVCCDPTHLRFSGRQPV